MNQKARKNTAGLLAQKPHEAEPSTKPGTLPPSSTTLRVLIVDDHAIVRDGLRQILAGKFPHATFGQGRSATEALERVSKEKWDVMLLDITMPGPSGFDVLGQIKLLQPDIKVLVLTMHPEDQYAMRALKAGASGYLTKETASEEVVGAVNKVLAGGRYVSAAFAEKLVAQLNAPEQRAGHELLSDREYQVLRMTAAGRSVKEIAFDLSLSIKTVSTYRTRMMAKTGLKTNAAIIRYALEHKLV